MQFTGRSRGRRSGLTCDYPCALQLYKLPPTEVVSLQEFEEMAEKRLRCELDAHTHTHKLYVRCGRCSVAVCGE